MAITQPDPLLPLYNAIAKGNEETVQQTGAALLAVVEREKSDLKREVKLIEELVERATGQPLAEGVH